MGPKGTAYSRVWNARDTGSVPSMENLSRLIFIFLLCAIQLIRAKRGLELWLQWRYLEWPEAHLTGRNYTIGNSFTQDVDVDRWGRIFVTSPQWLNGVPVSLSIVTDRDAPGGPLLSPYPDWTWHTVTAGCESIISVYRVAIDKCDRLWVVDSGRSEGVGLCDPKILIFDLKTDRLILKHVIPREQSLNRAASYVTPIVEVGENCYTTWLYVADVDKNGLLVYSFFNDRSFRVNNTIGNAFGPDEDAMYITIANDTFDLTDGTLGMSLSPPHFYGGERFLFFNSLASYHEKFMSTNALKFPGDNYPVIFKSKIKRPSQSGVEAMSSLGVMFFPLQQLHALACWDIEKPYIPENIVVLARNEIHIQYISGIKILTNMYGEEEVWFNTNRLQRIIKMTLDPREINYRILKGNVKDLIAGTRCEPGPSTRPLPNVKYWDKI